jgi:hypothetical protein
VSREIRRIAVDFDWPLNEVWQGYLMPEELLAESCLACENGYSEHGKYLHDLWYGYVPFKPEDNGSTPLSPNTPAVREFAERNVNSAPEFYGRDPMAVLREATRLADMWNGQWSHHLNEDDVAALVAGDRLWDLTHTWDPENRWQPMDPFVIPTPEQVNEWDIRSMGHDSINASICTRARCDRDGKPYLCARCDGSGQAWRSDEHKAAHEAWEPTEPPAGDGWQVWNTVSEGSPVTPVFATRAELVDHLCTPGQQVTLREGPMARDEAERFVDAGWVPSGMGSAVTRVVEGALTPSVMEDRAQFHAIVTGDES